MTASQLTGSTVSTRALPTFDGLGRSSPVSLSCFAPLKQTGRSFRPLAVKAATVISPRFASVKPMADRVLVKIKAAEEKTLGGILLPSTAITKPQFGEVVAIGEGRTVGKNKVEISLELGMPVVYSKYAGTELDFNGSSHLILKEDDIVGILETDEIKDLKPLNDRVLIKVAEAEEKTTGGLLLTDASKEKPSIGTVVAVGPGPLGEEGTRKPLSVAAGNTVLYYSVWEVTPKLYDSWAWKSVLNMRDELRQKLLQDNGQHRVDLSPILHQNGGVACTRVYDMVRKKGHNVSWGRMIWQGDQSKRGFCGLAGS